MRALVYSPLDKNFVPVKKSDKTLRLADIKRRKAALEENESASLRDMGDGVLLLEFHSKMNAFDADIFEIIQKAVERLHGAPVGLVIGNEGEHFSAGANLADGLCWRKLGSGTKLKRMIKQGQDMFMALRTAPKPVVAAPFNMALGGGVEVSLASPTASLPTPKPTWGWSKRASALSPAGAAVKRWYAAMSARTCMPATSIQPPICAQIFETIGFAKVSTSAVEARALGLSARHG